MKTCYKHDRVFFEVFDCFSGFGIVVEDPTEEGVMIDADLSTINTVYPNQTFDETAKVSFYKWDELYSFNVTGEAKYRQDIRGFITCMDNGVSYSVWSCDLSTEEKDIISSILKNHENEGGSTVVEKRTAFGCRPTETNFAMISKLNLQKLSKDSAIVTAEEIKYIKGTLQLCEMDTLALHNLRDMVVLYYSSVERDFEKFDLFRLAKSKITAVIDNELFENGGEV